MNKFLSLFFKKKQQEKRVINKIILYTISYDLMSKELKEILITNNIKWDEEIEVDKDVEMGKKLLDKKLDTFPFLDIDGEIIIGIDIKKINKIFDLKIKNKITLKDRLGYSQI